MDLFGKKSQELLAKAQELLQQAQTQMNEDIQNLQKRQTASEARIARLERQHSSSADIIKELQKNLDGMRDSAIRGEIASGRKTKDVAEQFHLSPSRITQIAPRRKYKNG